MANTASKSTDQAMGDAVPKGYLKNAEGHLVPEKMVKPIDKERDRIVRSLVEKAKQLRDPLSEFRRESEETIQAFIQASAAQYDVSVGGKKGNVSLLSYDGQYKIMRTYGELIMFDERIHAAKALIDECIHRWVKGSRTEIKALVDHAFQTDKTGKINTDRVLGLKKLNITDEQWLKAMQAITDSLQVLSRKSYVRLYERNAEGEYEPIQLDIAAL
jgi:hypothetical protein